MVFRESITLIVIGALAIVGLIGYASSIFLGDDNAVEETCEAAIQAETGLDVDLTPGSQEQVAAIQPPLVIPAALQMDATDLADKAVMDVV